ncbi:MAG TPA: hypothetical protein VFJ91_05230 [Gaiellaceae bacterium]|nr:hypothetical protein [Gaiellaceae bacterium]
MARALALLPLVLALAACGGGGGSLPTTTATSAPPAKKTLRVALSAESHHPKLGHTWTYEVRVTDAATGEPVPAHIHLQFTFGGSPVGEVGKHVVRDGLWKETIPAHGKDAFPPAAVGPKLQLRATATSPGYKPAVTSYAVQVVK